MNGPLTIEGDGADTLTGAWEEGGSGTLDINAGVVVFPNQSPLNYSGLAGLTVVDGGGSDAIAISGTSTTTTFEHIAGGGYGDAVTITLDPGSALNGPLTIGGDGADTLTGAWEEGGSGTLDINAGVVVFPNQSPLNYSGLAGLTVVDGGGSDAIAISGTSTTTTFEHIAGGGYGDAVTITLDPGSALNGPLTIEGDGADTLTGAWEEGGSGTLDINAGVVVFPNQSPLNYSGLAGLTVVDGGGSDAIAISGTSTTTTFEHIAGGGYGDAVTITLDPGSALNGPLTIGGDGADTLTGAWEEGGSGTLDINAGVVVFPNQSPLNYSGLAGLTVVDGGGSDAIAISGTSTTTTFEHIAGGGYGDAVTITLDPGSALNGPLTIGGDGADTLTGAWEEGGSGTLDINAGVVVFPNQSPLNYSGLAGLTVVDGGGSDAIAISGTSTTTTFEHIAGGGYGDAVTITLDPVSALNGALTIEGNGNDTLTAVWEGASGTMSISGSAVVFPGQAALTYSGLTGLSVIDEAGSSDVDISGTSTTTSFAHYGESDGDVITVATGLLSGPLSIEGELEYSDTLTAIWEAASGTMSISGSAVVFPGQAALTYSGLTGLSVIDEAGGSDVDISGTSTATSFEHYGESDGDVITVTTGLLSGPLSIEGELEYSDTLTAIWEGASGTMSMSGSAVVFPGQAALTYSGLTGLSVIDEAGGSDVDISGTSTATSFEHYGESDGDVITVTLNPATGLLPAPLTVGGELEYGDTLTAVWEGDSGNMEVNGSAVYFPGQAALNYSGVSSLTVLDVTGESNVVIAGTSTPTTFAHVGESDGDAITVSLNPATGLLPASLTVGGELEYGDTLTAVWEGDSGNMEVNGSAVYFPGQAALNYSGVSSLTVLDVTGESNVVIAGTSTPTTFAHVGESDGDAITVSLNPATGLLPASLTVGGELEYGDTLTAVWEGDSGNMEVNGSAVYFPGQAALNYSGVSSLTVLDVTGESNVVIAGTSTPTTFAHVGESDGDAITVSLNPATGLLPASLTVGGELEYGDTLTAVWEGDSGNMEVNGSAVYFPGQAALNYSGVSSLTVLDVTGESNVVIAGTSTPTTFAHVGESDGDAITVSLNPATGLLPASLTVGGELEYGDTLTAVWEGDSGNMEVNGSAVYFPGQAALNYSGVSSLTVLDVTGESNVVIAGTSTPTTFAHVGESDGDAITVSLNPATGLLPASLTVGGELEYGDTLTAVWEGDSGNMEVNGSAVYFPGQAALNYSGVSSLTVLDVTGESNVVIAGTSTPTTFAHVGESDGDAITVSLNPATGLLPASLTVGGELEYGDTLTAVWEGDSGNMEVNGSAVYFPGQAALNYSGVSSLTVLDVTGESNVVIAGTSTPTTFAHVGESDGDAITVSLNPATGLLPAPLTVEGELQYGDTLTAVWEGASGNMSISGSAVVFPGQAAITYGGLTGLSVIDEAGSSNVDISGTSTATSFEHYGESNGDVITVATGVLSGPLSIEGELEYSDTLTAIWEGGSGTMSISGSAVVFPGQAAITYGGLTGLSVIDEAGSSNVDISGTSTATSFEHYGESNGDVITVTTGLLSGPLSIEGELEYGDTLTAIWEGALQGPFAISGSAVVLPEQSPLSYSGLASLTVVDARGGAEVAISGTSTATTFERTTGDDDAITVTLSGSSSGSLLGPLTIDGDGGDALTGVWEGALQGPFAISGSAVVLPEQSPLSYSGVASLTVVDARGGAEVAISGTSTATTFERTTGDDDAITVTLSGSSSGSLLGPLTIDGDGGDALTGVWEGALQGPFAISGSAVVLPEQSPLSYSGVASLTVVDARGGAEVAISGTSTATTFERTTGDDDVITVTLSGSSSGSLLGPLTIDGDGGDALTGIWEGALQGPFAISGSAVVLPEQSPLSYSGVASLTVVDARGGAEVAISGTSTATTFERTTGDDDVITVTLSGSSSGSLLGPLTIDGDGGDAVVVNWEGSVGGTFTISAGAVEFPDQAPVFYGGLNDLIVADGAGGASVAIAGTSVPTTVEHTGSGGGDAITISGSLYAPLSVQGNGNDSLTYRYVGGTPDGNFTVSGSQVLAPGQAAISYAGLASLTVEDNVGSATIAEAGTSVPTMVEHTGSGGGDAITINGSLYAPLSVEGNGNDSLTYRYVGGTPNGNFTVSGSQVLAPGQAPISYAGLASLSVVDAVGDASVAIAGTSTATTFQHIGSGSGDAITVTDGSIEVPVALEGNGNDTLTVNNVTAGVNLIVNATGVGASNSSADAIVGSYTGIASLTADNQAAAVGVEVVGSTSVPATLEDTGTGAGSFVITNGSIQVPLTVQGNGSDTLSFTGNTCSLGALSIFNATADFTVPVAQIGPLFLQAATADFNTGSATLLMIPSLTLTQNSSLGGADSLIVTGAFDWTNSILTGAVGSSLTALGGIAIGGNVFVAGRTLTNAGTATWSAGTVTVTVTGGGTLNNGPSAVFGSPGNSGSLDLNNGTLSGFGTINANVSNNGQVDPGGQGTPGALTINGAYSQLSSASLNIALGGTSPGGQYDQLIVSGAASLGGTLDVATINGFQPALGDAFQVLTFGSYVGNFADYNGMVLGHRLILSPAFDSTNLTLTVQSAATTTTVSASPSPSVFGQSVSFTATVTVALPPTTTDPRPTGTVTFYDSGQVIGTGMLSVVSGQDQASFMTSALRTASHSITAAYTTGDANFVPSPVSAAVTQVVNRDSTTTVASASPAFANVAQTVTFTATVTANTPGSGTPTGTVDFYDTTTSTDLTPGGLALSSGTATFATASLASGAHTIKATYSGDSNFITSNGTAGTVTVGQSIIVLDPTAGGALSLSGNASINLPGGVYVNSSSSSASIRQWQRADQSDRDRRPRRRSEEWERELQPGADDRSRARRRPIRLPGGTEHDGTDELWLLESERQFVSDHLPGHLQPDQRLGKCQAHNEWWHLHHRRRRLQRLRQCERDRLRRDDLQCGQQVPEHGRNLWQHLTERQRVVQPDSADHRDLRRRRDLPVSRQQ